MSDEQEIRRLIQDVRHRSWYGREPKRVRELLSRVMTRHGYGAERSAADLLKVWRQAAGPGLAEHSRPGNLRRGVLEIHARSSVILQELTFRKQQLLTQVQEKISPKIRDLRFRTGY